MNQEVFLTIFTPTYNRAHFLPRLFKSIVEQEFSNLEWIIVDDGSTDNTKEVVQKLINQKEYFKKDFPIIYRFQENGGKHRAINTGVELAKGILFFIADSDDILAPNALSFVNNEWQKIQDNNGFAGICGLDSTFDGTVIGSGLNQQVIDDNSLNVRFKHNVTGDMKEVFRTSILKEFPFPDIPNEKFCPESLIWNRISTKYKLRFFNKSIYQVEYQPDGISAGIIKSRMNSPIASMMTYAEMIDYNISFFIKIKSAINYWRFSFCAKKDKYTKLPVIGFKWRFLRPVGYFMHLRDQRL